LIVVSDTSPILNLARIGRLELLASLYEQVLIPPAVLAELFASRGDFPAIDIASVSWLILGTPKDHDRVLELRKNLDVGEAESIILALERQAELLLVDERRGRRIAAALGLRITGLLGVLAYAKRAGLIELVKPILDELIQNARFWIGSDLYRDVLSELGEG
jgi:predicted nucleic acid-binding protein